MTTHPRKRKLKGQIISVLAIIVCIGIICVEVWSNWREGARRSEQRGTTDVAIETTSAPDASVQPETDPRADSNIETTTDLWSNIETEPITETETVITETETDPPVTEPELDLMEVLYIARAIAGEGGTGKLERSAVAWCILNRVDSSRFSNTVIGVVTAANQFHLSYAVYDSDMELAADVLSRWLREKNGETNVGRTLPSGYYYFRGFKWAERATELGMARPTKSHNWFFTLGEYNKAKFERNYWDWSLPNPYE